MQTTAMDHDKIKAHRKALGLSETYLRETIPNRALREAFDRAMVVVRQEVSEAGHALANMTKVNESPTASPRNREEATAYYVERTTKVATACDVVATAFGFTTQEVWDEAKTKEGK